MDQDQVESIKRYFDVVAEQTRTEIQLLAEKIESLDEKVNGIDGRLEQTRREMHEGFDELKAMIKFSYAELDRRVGSLESALSSLQARVEKLEAGTRH